MGNTNAIMKNIFLIIVPIIFFCSCVKEEEGPFGDTIITDQFENHSVGSYNKIPSFFGVEANVVNALALTNDGKGFLAAKKDNRLFFVFFDKVTDEIHCSWHGPVIDTSFYVGYGEYMKNDLIEIRFFNAYKHFQDSYVIGLIIGYNNTIFNSCDYFFCDLEKVNKVVSANIISNGTFYSGFENACFIDSFCYDICTGDTIYKYMADPHFLENESNWFWLSTKEAFHIKNRMFHKYNFQNVEKGWSIPAPYLENELSNTRITYTLLQQTAQFVQYKMDILRYDGTTAEYTFKIDLSDGRVFTD